MDASQNSRRGNDDKKTRRRGDEKMRSKQQTKKRSVDLFFCGIKQQVIFFLAVGCSCCGDSPADGFHAGNCHDC